MVRDDLVELEHGFWDAAGDGEFYLEHMHPEGRCLLPVGVMDKNATADAISKAEPWSAHTFEDLETHEPTDDVAVLTYRAIGTRNDADTYEALVSTIYLRENGSWQLYTHQQTPLVAGGP